MKRMLEYQFQRKQIQRFATHGRRLHQAISGVLCDELHSGGTGVPPVFSNL